MEGWQRPSRLSCSGARAWKFWTGARLCGGSQGDFRGAVTWTGWVNPALGARRPDRRFWKQSPHLLQPGIQPPCNIQSCSLRLSPNSCSLPGLVPLVLGPGCALAFKHTQEVGGGWICPTWNPGHSPQQPGSIGKARAWENTATQLSGRTEVGGGVKEGWVRGA